MLFVSSALINNGLCLLGVFTTSLAFSLLCGWLFFRYVSHFLQAKSRECAPDRHKAKDNTPTMGGLCLVAAVIATIFLWTDLFQSIVLCFLTCFLGFAAIGFWDDWNKLAYGRGISARNKFVLQAALSLIVGLFLLRFGHIDTAVYMPFSYNIFIPLGYCTLVWVMFVLIGTANAVNLTDGLDGLAIGSLIPNFLLFMAINIFAFLSITLPRVMSFGNQEVAVIAAALAGACVGFWYYNRHPARMFMGDVGSLALGSALAFCALVTRWECLLVATGLVFVVETLSVILQVWSYRYRGKRLFKMAPLHHHFELCGWQEITITRCFSGITWLLCALTPVLFWYLNK